MTAFAERRISRALKNLQQPSGDPASSRTAVVGVEPALLKRGGIRLDPLSTTGNAMPQVILRIDAESSPTTGAWLKFRANARGVNQPTLLTKGDLPAQMADVRKRHPDDLLIVWAATDSAPPARLVEAGADIVITPTREASFSISMMKDVPSSASAQRSQTAVTQNRTLRCGPRVSARLTDQSLGSSWYSTFVCQRDGRRGHSRARKSPPCTPAR